MSRNNLSTAATKKSASYSDYDPNTATNNFIAVLKENFDPPWPSDDQIRQALLSLRDVRRPHKMRGLQYLNYLAVHFLEAIGIDDPTQEAIDLIELLLEKYSKQTSMVSKANHTMLT